MAGLPRGSTGAAEEGLFDRGTKYVSTDDEQARFSVANNWPMLSLS